MINKTTSPNRGAVEARNVGEILGNSDPGYMFKKAIQAVKDAVPIEQVAAEYTELKREGAGRLFGHCVAPDHEDHSPSMCIYADHIHCFACGLHCDVVDLEQVAGRHVEKWTAVRALAERYGVELPQRPGSWFARQERQRPVRDALEEARVRSVHRRMFRIFVRETLSLIEDEAERREEGRAIWEDLRPIAKMLVARGGWA